MFSLLHVEYFFGFGMFILGITKVSPSPAPSFASLHLTKKFPNNRRFLAS